MASAQELEVVRQFVREIAIASTIWAVVFFVTFVAVLSGLSWWARRRASRSRAQQAAAAPSASASSDLGNRLTQAMEEATRRKQAEAEEKAKQDQLLISLLSETTECLKRLSGVESVGPWQGEASDAASAAGSADQAEMSKSEIRVKIPDVWREDNEAVRVFGQMWSMPLDKVLANYSLTPELAENMCQTIAHDLQVLSQGETKPVKLNVENLLYRTADVPRADIRQRLAQLWTLVVGQAPTNIDLRMVPARGSAAIEFTDGHINPDDARELMEKLCSDD